MNRLQSGVFLLFLTCLAGAAHAQRVTVSETVEKYSIYGKTPAALLREMYAKGPPPAFGGPRFFARAAPDFSWNFTSARKDGRCAIGDFGVSVNIRYTLPFWADRDKAGKRLVAYWDAFIVALWGHERGHGEIAIDEARAIAAALKRLPAQADCETLQAEAGRVLQEIVKNSTRQADYDQETKHGKTQGAFFDVAQAHRAR